jgi:glycosyltransferase involved in cell wall biosynthesis
MSTVSSSAKTSSDASMPDINSGSGRTLISIITPAFNEEDNLPELHSRLHAVADPLGIEWEWLVVDDHSTDGTWGLLRKLAEKDHRIRAMRFSRNFGSHLAIACALQHADGQAAVIMAADLQDPPETLPFLVERWCDGSDVVWAVRKAREAESTSTKLCSAMYCWLMRRWVLPNMPAQGADFVLMDRKVIDAYNGIAEKNTSFVAIILWMGFRQTFIEYVKRARHAGKSKWTVAKKLKLLVDSIVSFSYVPIRAISYAGLGMAVIGFAYAAFVVAGRIFGWIVVGTGFAALMTMLLVGQGMILTTLGVLGEYLWRTFDEARDRPRYIVEEYIPSAQQDDRILQALERSRIKAGGRVTL